VLRIDRSVDGEVETLSVAGRLVGPWLTELRREVAAAAARSRRVELDLSGVSYAHAEAARFLRELASGGTRIRKSSSFVDELLRSSGS
jgi:hypothetical protein